MSIWPSINPISIEMGTGDSFPGVESSYSIQRLPTDPVYFASLLLDNIVSGSAYRLVVNSSGALLESGMAAGPQVNTDPMPAYSNGMTVRGEVRKSDATSKYLPAVIYASLVRDGASAWVPQQADLFALVGDSSSITGITIDGAAGTITQTQDRTVLEVYSYCQWWAAQHLEYAVPMSTIDGLNFSTTYTYTVQAGSSLTGKSKLTVSGTTFTGASELIVTDINGTTYRRTLTGAVAGSTLVVYDNDSADPQNLGTELLRVASVSGPVVLTYSGGKVDDDVVVKVIRPGYRIYSETITLGDSNATTIVAQQPETN